LDTVANTTPIPLEPLLARARVSTNQVVTLDAVPVRAPVSTRLRTGSLAAAAALTCIAVAALWLTHDGERFGLPKTYSTAHGEQSERALPDGSVLHLNTDSQVTVRYSRRERVVDLDRGEALFQVTHQDARGFRVAAGNAQVLDVGTQFDVYRKSEKVLITVVDGTVAVFTGPPQLTPNSLRVSAGYEVEVQGQVGLPRLVNARAAVAWLHRQIVFDNQPLGEVADEFNRYGRSIFEIDDETLRALPITGVFDAYDADSFAAFLATLNGVVVRKTPPRIRVLRQPSAPREPLPVAR
jgi:transmembrane sensor